MGCNGSKADPPKSEAKSSTNNEPSVRNVSYQNNRTNVEKKGESAAVPPAVVANSPIKADVKIKPIPFKELMADKEGRAYFMKFLQHEHAEENLVFFEVNFYDEMISQYTAYDGNVLYCRKLRI